MASRVKTTKTTITVQHFAEPTGRARENGPHLGDLREFVDAAKGLPDDVKVRIQNGHMGESGRYDVEISLFYVEPDPEDIAALKDLEALRADQ